MGEGAILLVDGERKHSAAGAKLAIHMMLRGEYISEYDAHVGRKLAYVLAGGGFKHGQHLAFDRTNNYPLTNLFVSMLQRLGIEAREFSTGRATMRGLEMA